MKKLLLLCLVLLGGVMQVSAQTFYFGLEIPSISPSNVKVYRYGATGADSWDNPGQATEVGLKYGRHWYSIDLNGQPNAIVRVGSGDNDSSDDISSVNTSKYYYVSNEKSGGSSNDRYNVGTVDNPFSWQHLTCRNNIVGYSVTDDNMTRSSSDDTFTYELTKATIGNNTDIYFRFRQGDFVPLKDDDTSVRAYAEILPKSNNQLLSIASNTTDYYQDASTSWVWKINVPSYDFEKLVITAKYVNESGYKWKISADAYITKTVSGDNQYATLGCSVPLEIVDANNVTAYPLTANASTGQITKGTAITVIPANEGALLENTTGENKTIRAKVLASASASASNDLVAFLDYGNKLDKVTETGKTNYILTIKNSKVGFYMVNSNGNAMGANTAYLKVADSSSGARSAYFFDNETTGIANVEINANDDFDANAPIYNLAGQRVNKSYRGVVIVNGKKMLNK